MSTPDPEWVNLRQQILQLEHSGTADPDQLHQLEDQLYDRYLQLARGGVTPGGLPYPDPTDPVAEGADAIRALAEAIDSALTALAQPEIIITRTPDLIDLSWGAAWTGLMTAAWFAVAKADPGFEWNGRIRVPTDGRYDLQLWGRFTQGSLIGVNLNTTDVAENENTISILPVVTQVGTPIASAIGTVELHAGDQLALMGYSASGQCQWRKDRQNGFAVRYRGPLS